MRVTLKKTASIGEVLRELGVPKADVGRLSAEVARRNGVAATARLTPGVVLEIADRYVKADKQQRVDAARDDAAGGPSQPMGVLGLLGVRAQQKKRTGNNPLGALWALTALDIAGSLVDKAELAVRVVLKPGPHAIPIGDKQLLLDIPAGTALTYISTVLPDGAGFRVAEEDFAFSKPVRVVNPADLTLAAGTKLATAGNRADVTLDGVAVSAAGTLSPRGHVGALGMRVPLQGVAALLGTATAHMGVEARAGGKLMRSAPLLANDAVRHIDVSAVLASVGAVAEKGTFSLKVAGRSGFVDVRAGKMTVVGLDRKLTATVTGDFTVKGGAIRVNAQAQPVVPLDARVVFSPGGDPGASVGPLSVSAVDGKMEISINGALTAAVSAVAAQYHVAVPANVHLRFDGRAVTTASATLRLVDNALVVEDGSVRVVIDAAGASATADTLHVNLARGSTLTLNATGISTRGDDVLVENSSAAFHAEVEGSAQAGRLKVGLSGMASGDVELALDGGAPRADASIAVKLTARPLVAGLQMPVWRTVGAAADVVVTPTSIAVRNAR